jgi:uncharacterized protein YndB with AHSA1/START domain
MPNSEIFNVTTPTNREIVVTRVFNAPRNLVFDAWTNPQYLPHWMLGPDGWTMPVCEIDLAPAAHGTSSGATPTAKKWRCAASIGKSNRPSA